MHVKSHKFRILLELMRSTLPVIIFVVVYGLCCLAYCHQYHLNGMEVHPTEILYKSLRLFVLEGGIDEPKLSGFLNLMRFVAPLTTVMGAIAAFTVLLGRRFKDLRLTMLADHVVICGLGRKGNTLARQFQTQGKKVVIIDIDETNEYFSIQMLSNIWMIAGNAADPEVLSKANLSSASCLVIATGSDSTNINILIHAANLIKRHNRTQRLNVVLHMYDPDICPLMRNKQVLKSIRESVSLITVNMYELAARKLFTRDMIKNMPTAVQDRRRMHVIIAGFGYMGQAIALQAAKIGHFANAAQKAITDYTSDLTDTDCVKTRITVIDAHAKEACKTLQDRFPKFGELCELCPVEGDLLASDSQEKLIDSLKNTSNLSSIFVCHEDDYYNLKKALSLVPLLHKQKPCIGQLCSDIDIFVELSESEGLYHLLEDENSDTDWARQLIGFMAIPDVFHVNETNDKVFEIIAQVIAAFYENRFGIPISIEKSGWENLSFRLQDSNMQAAHHMIIKLATMDYELVISEKANWLSEQKNSIFLPTELIQLPITDAQKEILARMEHNRWLAEIKLEGYSYGAKDHELRTHPCCLPWEQLEERDRQKDIAQIEIIPIAALNAGCIPMKRDMATLYRQLDSQCKIHFEALAIGLLKGGAALVGKFRKYDISDFLDKTDSREILIISGVPDKSQYDKTVNDRISAILTRFSGVVITGLINTEMQKLISSITENLQKQNQKKYILLDYPPQETTDTNTDKKYDSQIRTKGLNISSLQPIQYWLDIVLARTVMEKVTFLQLENSNETGFDLLLSKALGADIEILE